MHEQLLVPQLRTETQLGPWMSQDSLVLGKLVSYLYFHHRLRCPVGYRVFLLSIAPPVAGLERLSLAMLPKQLSYRRTNNN